MTLPPGPGRPFSRVYFFPEFVPYGRVDIGVRPDAPGENPEWGDANQRWNLGLTVNTVTAIGNVIRADSDPRGQKSARYLIPLYKGRGNDPRKISPEEFLKEISRHDEREPFRKRKLMYFLPALRDSGFLGAYAEDLDRFIRNKDFWMRPNDEIRPEIRRLFELALDRLKGEFSEDVLGDSALWDSFLLRYIVLNDLRGDPLFLYDNGFCRILMQERLRQMSASYQAGLEKDLVFDAMSCAEVGRAAMERLGPNHDPFVSLAGDSRLQERWLTLVRRGNQGGLFARFNHFQWDYLQTRNAKSYEAVRAAIQISPAEIFKYDVNDLAPLPPGVAATDPLSPPPLRALTVGKTDRVLPWVLKERAPDLVMHLQYGEGRVLSTRQDGDREFWEVRFPFWNDGVPVRLLPHTLTRLNDPAINRVLSERGRCFVNILPVLSAIAMDRCLSEADPAFPYSFAEGSEPLTPGQLRAQIIKSTFGAASAGDDTKKQRKPGMAISHLLSLSPDKVVKSVKMSPPSFVADHLGIDPIHFALRLMLGHEPCDVLGLIWANPLNRFLTPATLEWLIDHRPWHDALYPAQPARENRIATVQVAAGYLYPKYYVNYGPEAPRPHDLNQLYYALREGDEEAIAKTAEYFEPFMERAIKEGGLERDRVLLVPMIGKAPLERVGKLLPYPQVFPWNPRPADYGRGVDYRLLLDKLHLLRASLSLNPGHLERMRGRDIIVFDDGIGDGATYVEARRLLLDAGARSVRVVVLAELIRHPREFQWSIFNRQR